MNRVCKPYLDKFVIVFIDDILIYSRNKEEHTNHLRIILELLRKEKLYAKFSKCDFWIRIVQILGHLIDSQGLHVDPTKIKAIKIWKTPTTPTEKYKKYIWEGDQESAFQLLKQKLYEVLILALPEGNNDFVIYCDASLQDYDYEIRYHLGKSNVIADALSQKKQIKPLSESSYNQNYGSDQIQTPQYPDVHPSSPEQNLKELAEYKESLDNSSTEIATLNSNEEKEGPPHDSDIRQLIREECSVEVCKEQKQKMEDTILELVEICRQKELYCIHDNVEDLIESARNSKLLSINSNSQRLDEKEQEVENVVEQPAERGTCIKKSLQNFRVIHKSSISLNNTSQISPIHAESDFDFEEEIHLIESLLYVNSSSQPPKEHNVEEERIKREHVEYISRMKMLFTINPRPRPTVNANMTLETLPSLPIPIQDNDSQREEIDIITSTDDVLPPGVENDDDSDGEVDAVDDLRVDNSISNFKHEYSDDEASDSDYQDNPSVPLPPLEPPDEELDFEIDFGDEISVVRNTIVEFEYIDAKDEFDVSNDENDDYFPIMFVIRIFLPYLICSKMFLFFSPLRVRISSLTLDQVTIRTMCQPNDQNIDFSGSDQIQTLQYPDVHPPSPEQSDEVFQAKGDLMNSIQTFLEEFNYIPFGEKSKILLKAWDKFFTIQRAQPENSNELFQKLLEDLKELAEYKESLDNSSTEITTSNSNEEKEGPPHDSDIRQLIREECFVEVCKEQKQKMEDTILELVEICRQKELYCIHDNVEDLIESARNSKLLSINLNSQRLDEKEQEVENVVEQPAERGTCIEKSLQNFRVIHKSSISLNNTSQIYPVHAVAPILSTEEHDHSLTFTTFSNPLFNNNDDLDSSDDESLPEEDVPAEKFNVYSNPIFDEDEINSNKLDPHCFNVESDFVESLLNRDTFINSSSKFDFSGELAHVNPEIKESDFDFEEEIHLIESLLYVNSSSQPPKEHNAEEERIKREHVEYISRMEMLFIINPRPRPTVNANTTVETLPSLPIPIQDNDSQREEIDIITSTDDVLPPGVENDDDSDGEVDTVDDLRVDNSILNFKHEYFDDEASDSDHQDNPSVPLLPPEPPDEELDFEIDFGDEISVVRNTIIEFECIDAKDEFDVLMMKMMITFLSCLSSESFYHILSVPRCFFLFSPLRVRILSLTLVSPFRSGGISLG
uniref:Putative reverse transcriptase domain-containing protein n=1 Tax=Tanacetum cinerariifolium TaxID=118510 RepID=A0A6L2LZX8_TANCI|nr:putative reverse transcriptase domain-containing protein [Tanacetum cinerariifolium]